MQPCFCGLAVRQLIENQLTGPVVYFFERPIHSEPNAQVVVWDVVHGKGEMITECGFDLNHATIISYCVMMLRQPFIQSELVMQACDYLPDITHQSSVWSKGLTRVCCLKLRDSIE